MRVADPEARVDALPGFAEGAWWVQDAAAALPARLLGDIAGRHVADLCAAPGGKTAQLAAAGAHVTAVDVSPKRLARVRENLARLHLYADVVTAESPTWQPGRTFDAVLLDAPCTATGTIRRHPDILHLKRATDLAPLVELQSRLLDRAAALAQPRRHARLLHVLAGARGRRAADRTPARPRSHASRERPVHAGEHGIDAAWITPAGDLRTLPFHQPGGTDVPGGMDGFYAARLRKA